MSLSQIKNFSHFFFVRKLFIPVLSFLLFGVIWVGFAYGFHHKKRSLSIPFARINISSFSSKTSYFIARRRRSRGRRSRRRRKIDSLSPSSINLNTATLKEFQRLPRIGPKKAARIVKLRQRLGGSFQSISQLRQVRGIGKKTLANIRPYLYLNNSSPNPPRRRYKPRRRYRPSPRRKYKTRRRYRPSPRRRYKSRRRYRPLPPLRHNDYDRVHSPRHRRNQNNRSLNPSSRAGQNSRFQRIGNCYKRWEKRYPQGFIRLLNINTSSIKQIQKLPCIGRKRALALVSIRTVKGPFSNHQDLKKVVGIGPKRLAWLRPLLTYRINLNTATLQELERVSFFTGGLGQAIHRYRIRKGPFRSFRQLLRIRGLGKSTLRRIRPFIYLSSSLTKHSRSYKIKRNKRKNTPSTPPRSRHNQIIYIP